MQLTPTPFLKSLFLLPSFLLHSLLRYFRQFPPPSRNPTCPNPTHQLSLHIINAFNKYQKSDFTSSTVAFYQKSIFDIYIVLQIYQVILIYGIFSASHLHNLEWLFFIKLWWQKKIIFPQIHNTILQRVKWFQIVKMINLEKIK